MLLFAHTGIALGAGVIVAGVINRCKESSSWFASLTRYADIRIFMIGSMLPDLIDKPVGHYLFRDTFQNGRIFSHSLLFLVLLTAIGLILYKAKHQVWMLTLAAGTLIHLALDQMWHAPETLFWPFMGWSFKVLELEDFMESITGALTSDPTTIITESLGLAILIWFGLVVLQKKKAGLLLKTGRIN